MCLSNTVKKPYSPHVLHQLHYLKEKQWLHRQSSSETAATSPVSSLRMKGMPSSIEAGNEKTVYPTHILNHEASQHKDTELPMRSDRAGTPPSPCPGKSIETCHSQQCQYDSTAGRYSRQVLVLGNAAQEKLRNSKVLIAGLQGTGAEIAKNLILMGVQQVTLYDNDAVQFSDLSSSFCVSEKDVKHPRAERSVKILQELSSFSKVEVIKDLPLNRKFLAQFDVIVVVNWNHKKAIHLNHLCRSLHSQNLSNNSDSIEATSTTKKPLFVSVGYRGVFGYIFNDFGDNFEIKVSTDAIPTISRITEISYGQRTFFSCNIDEQTPDFYFLNWIHSSLSSAVYTAYTRFKGRHGLQTGDFVKFYGSPECLSLYSLDSKKLHEIQVHSATTFSLPIDSSRWASYSGGLSIENVMLPKYVSFQPLEEALKQPTFLTIDVKKEDQHERVQNGFLVYDLYLEKYGRPPRSGHKGDALKFHQLWKKYFPKTFQSTFAECFAKIARGDLAPMATFLGGTAAQEIIKALTHVFTPIQQFLVFDAMETLPDPLPSSKACTPLHSRYDGQIGVFGRDSLSQLARLNVFIVGAGAIGCETLKTLALMGVSTHRRTVREYVYMQCYDLVTQILSWLTHCGLFSQHVLHRWKRQQRRLKQMQCISLADMDSVEESNLSRQFLFRKGDIYRSKARVAAQRLKYINPYTRVTPYIEKVGKETENCFNDVFWEEHVDVVYTALDNIPSRLYVDARCLFYGIPLLESGTLGTKGNTQVIVPHLTEPYGNAVDADTDQIPLCTIRGFPVAPEHALHWAMDAYKKSFVQRNRLVSLFLKDPVGTLLQHCEQGLESMHTLLEELADELLLGHVATIEDCIAWADSTFSEFFYYNVKRLLQELPSEELAEKSKKFGSPISLQLTRSDPLHFSFVEAAAILRSKAYNITLPAEGLKSRIRNFTPRAGRMPMPRHRLASLGIADASSSFSIPLHRRRLYYDFYRTKLKSDLPLSDIYLLLLVYLAEQPYLERELYEDIQKEAWNRFGKKNVTFSSTPIHSTLHRMISAIPMDASRVTLLDDSLNLLMRLVSFLESGISSPTFITGCNGTTFSTGELEMPNLGSTEHGHAYPWSQQISIPLEMELDMNQQVHLQFISACSNLRSRNFNIPELTLAQAQQIAAQIIPAIATVTAVVSALSCLELYKLVQLGYCNKKYISRDSSTIFSIAVKECKKRFLRNFVIPKAISTLTRGSTTNSPARTHLLRFKNCFINLGVPLFAMSHPLGSPKAWINTGKLAKQEYTAWEYFTIDCDRDLFLHEFLDSIEEKLGISVEMISSGDVVLYSTFSDEDYNTVDSSKETGSAEIPEPWEREFDPGVFSSTLIPLVQGDGKNFRKKFDVQMQDLIRRSFSRVGKRFPTSKSQKYILLDVCGINKETLEEIEMPPVRYTLKF
ncbi:hypothetical protein IE077_000174 [Cardiosporidium cionae]|uniref:Ubiquitin-activating enzyme E1 C-terminal domain-containing protein n=1 Tax=Cardiosporidium cionae TaxID=476202 RepID=A0ABQ7JCX6_9APIC|nr:hypothetical protein IE077_000174 [Cardiosporidium cionae]|eukprot:KAF8821831.1 hypothetical protein IE077_000174 [Cardiosporidium cionae]